MDTQKIAELIANFLSSYNPNENLSAVLKEVQALQKSIDEVKAMVGNNGGGSPVPEKPEEPKPVDPKPEEPEPAEPETPKPEEPKPETPKPTEPSEPKLTRETSIRPFNNENWKDGVWITDGRAGFSIPANRQNIADYYIGETVILANDEEREITYVGTSGEHMTVLLNGPSLADISSEVGAPNKLRVVVDTTLPEPAPIPDLGFSVKVNNFNDPIHWNKGVFRTKAGISIPYSPEAEAAYTKNVNLEFADGQVRTIDSVQFVGDNMSVWVKGGLLDPLKVGAPNSVKTTSKAVNETSYNPPAEPEKPEPEKPVIVSPPGTGYTGRMCINIGLGMGAESRVPGKHFTEYRYPQLAEWQLVAKDGFKCGRLGFLWERLIRGGVGGTLSMDDIKLIAQSCEFAKQVGMTVMLDMHNYSGYGFGPNANNSLRDKIGTSRVPTRALGDDWFRIVEALWKFPVCREVIEGFDVMNEPIISWAAWKPALQHCVNRIAEIAPDKYIGCEGIKYSGTIHWVANNPGMETITHPKGKQFLVFHGHYYLDLGSDGFWTTPQEMADQIDPQTGVKGSQSYLNWLQTHGLRGAIGETMVPGIYPKSVQALDNALDLWLRHGLDVFMFFSAHGAGNNWHNIYKPENANTLKVIRKYSLRK